VDASSLYQLLENQIVPLYYAKPDGKLPLAWLQLMRESIRSVTPVFNTQRMVKEYTEQLYVPAAKSYENFSRDGCGAATHLSQWKTQIRKDWPGVKFRMFKSATKIDKAFWSVKRYKSRREFTWARSIRNMCEWKLTTVKWIMVTFAILRRLSSIKTGSADGDGDYIYQGAVPAS